MHNLKKTKPAWYTWRFIAETKLIYGFSSGLCVYAAAIAFMLPNFPATLVVVPVIMWISLRWFEDTVSTARAFLALGGLLCVNPETLSRLRATRSDLHRRVVHLAVDELGLPTDPERHFGVCGEANGRVVSRRAKGINNFLCGDAESAVGRRLCDCTNNSTTHQRIRNSIVDNVYIT
jgi:glycerol-3-phosphate O-acyltransferase/dihydroxyacetone phosphate acyltransferase